MKFKEIPVRSQPVYTWLWNGKITKEEIKRQIDEMYDSGIRAFYVLGEPENFRPGVRRTCLSPEYLSDAYLKLVRFAYTYAKEKGMYTWLYNEGGFPSGMVCGKIREENPHLAMLEVVKTSDGDYIAKPASGSVGKLRADIAKRETTDAFIHMTHESYKRLFGETLGSEIQMMFDDEAYMGSWTDGLDVLFEEKYGYSVWPYLSYIIGEKTPMTEKECRAVSDYTMLCGELVRENYFIPMREWLNKHKMISTGHLDLDNQTDGGKVRRYGNVMAMLRAFDAPGVDVIWSQITYPEDGRCCPEGNEFWTRCASAAARQQGKTLCISESFAVFGSHVTPEEMRFVVNFQAVRGISRFNFMVISYDRETAMACQYRPNFIKEYPGMNMLSEINDYTARISYILESGSAEVKTALYCPYRSISAGGDVGKVAADEYEKLGNMLECAGVDFDIIDEDFVQAARIENHKLCGEYAVYENVFLPEGRLEPEFVLEKLSAVPSEIVPCIKRANPKLLARKVCFEDGTYAYIICNTSNALIKEKISLSVQGNVYRIDLATGKLVYTDAEIQNGEAGVLVSLLRGELAVFYVSDKEEEAVPESEYAYLCDITEITGRTVRAFHFGDKGIINTYPESDEVVYAFTCWDEGFSGEVEYKTILPPLLCRDVILDLGDVRHFARIYLNGKPIAEKTMPPYRVKLCGAKSGDTLSILVANTAANVCARTDYFSRQDIADVGPYHEKMVKKEANAPAGGLLGPVKLYTEK